jgi:hypothetical protein
MFYVVVWVFCGYSWIKHNRPVTGEICRNAVKSHEMQQKIFSFVEKMMQLHTGAEHFGNVIFRYSELPSQYHIDASKDVNRLRQDCDITCLL